MIVDKDLEMSLEQAAFDTNDTVKSTYSIDLGATSTLHEEPLAIRAIVSTAFASGTSIQLVLKTDGALTGDNLASGNTVWSGPAIAVATAVKGYQFVTPNLKGLPLERYIQLEYLNAGNNDAGAITAGLVKDLQTAGPNPSLTV